MEFTWGLVFWWVEIHSFGKWWLAYFSSPSYTTMPSLRDNFKKRKKKKGVLASADFAWFILLSLHSEMKCANEVHNSRLVHLLSEWWWRSSPLNRIGWVNLISWPPSTRSLQICDESLPSFAVSTLVSLFREHSPNAERFIFPLLLHVLNPKKTLI